MLAVVAARIDPDDPLSGLRAGEHRDPSPADGWTTVTVCATALNHDDVWLLRGVGLLADQLRTVVDCDAAGVDENGNEVVVHSVVSDRDWQGDETLAPTRSLLSEHHPGTFAQRVAVLRRNLVPPSEARVYTD